MVAEPGLLGQFQKSAVRLFFLYFAVKHYQTPACEGLDISFATAAFLLPEPYPQPPLPKYKTNGT